jgi:hypothetical protein
MINLLKAILFSVRDMFRLRVLLFLFIPALASMILWGGLVWYFWNSLVAVAGHMVGSFFDVNTVPIWMKELLDFTPEKLAEILNIIMAIMMVVPVMILTSLCITSIFAMPMVDSIVSKEFPHLIKQNSVSFQASTRNLIISCLIYFCLWIATLPFWMVPGLGIAIPMVLNGYLNYRIFAFDCMAPYASERELKILMGRKRIDFMLLGVLIAALMLILPLNLILPLYAGFCFSRYSMMEVEKLREKLKAHAHHS